MENTYLSKYVVREPYDGYFFKIDYSVEFFNESKNIKKFILEKDGTFCDFPEIEYTKTLRKELGNCEILPQVKYEATFERLDNGKFLMVWTVRPDGMYWMDSWGFGAEDYESLSLYSFIDENGNFTAPFKIYSVGDKVICDKI